MTTPTLTRDAAIDAADQCAARAWQVAQGPGAFAWHDALRFRPSILAQYVAANRGANAMQLYRFCVAGEAGAAPWTRLPPAQRVAVEVFRATFLALLFEVEEAAEIAKLRALPVPASPPPIRLAPVRLAEKGREMHEAVSRLEQQWADDDGRPKSRRKPRSTRG